MGHFIILSKAINSKNCDPVVSLFMYGICIGFSTVSLPGSNFKTGITFKIVLKYTYNPNSMCRKDTRFYETEAGGFLLVL